MSDTEQRRDAVDNIELLDRAIAQTERIIAAISPEQASLPTPCAEWDVAALVTHVAVQDMRNFMAAARGETADWRAPVDPLSGDWAAAFAGAGRLLLETWRSEDVDRMVPGMGGHEVPLRARADQQIAELAVHGWDLVRATDQTIALDDQIAELALRWSRAMLRPEHRGPDKAFGYVVPVPEDAPAYDRLAGWFGRDPRWPQPESRALPQG